ncbi:uncharacterized protein PAC_08702 [Phialocephala subalpina]|uniref:Uncharacterized protein n=1 Tax=Phialocephala subalpina TaxID=576137 RepID=A0A1L7X1B4_9HELO|nr:uncharacterized protein PAC_08702 [Phialocephala subalpina]
MISSTKQSHSLDTALFDTNDATAIHRTVANTYESRRARRHCSMFSYQRLRYLHRLLATLISHTPKLLPNLSPCSEIPTFLDLRFRSARKHYLVPVNWSHQQLRLLPFEGKSAVAFNLSTSAPTPLLAAALTTPIPSPSNDPYDVHDHEPVTPTPAQRQQPARSLRRTHIEAVSPGISPPRVRFAEEQARRSEFAHDFEDDQTSTQLASSSQQVSPEAERRPHRALRISRNTASAILYTLEEALRHPHAFTPDLVEENAQMSDLLGGGPSASAGNGRSRGDNGRPPQAPPGTTGSPSGIKGPRDIMRERQAREARRKAEQDEKAASERRRAAEEQRLIEEERRRGGTAGAAQRGSGDNTQRGSGGTTGGPRISDNSQRSQRTSGGGPAGGSNQPLRGVGQGGSAIGGDNAGGSRPRPAQAPQPQPRPVQPQSSTRPRAGTGPNAAAGPSGPQPPQIPEDGQLPQTRSSFPHAFERWETLSAHWEGLTSFWIRRLEENSIEVGRDPLSQQLSRQVTDLSAAGANLFHAVVELQRLRASSERKFQRWFFETRAEQERAQEIQAMTQASLEEERNSRATDKQKIAELEEIVRNQKVNAQVEKQLAEMKRELQISKEEARRAWEELGRREQEERERTASLRDGQPTLVGGVQVVPMMQGVPSRHGSARERPQTQPEGPSSEEGAYSEYVRAQREPADPFVSTTTASSSRQQPAPSTYPGTHPAFTNSSPQGPAPAVQPTSTSPFYQQHQGTSLHPSEAPPSEGGFSEEAEYEIDSQGQFIRDARGNKVRYQAPASDEDDDEYDVAEQREREIANLARYGQVSGAASTSAGRTAGPTSAPSIGPPVDYSGQGYGGAPEWAAVPRHHHPTRLSDVLEEDERSRTSASQVSRRTDL